MDDKLKQLEEEQRKLMEQIESNNRKLNSGYSESSGSHGKNDLLAFFIGMVLLGGGLFWIFQSVRVTTSWGNYFLHIGSWGVPNGVIIIPFLIGIMMLFMMKRKIFGWIVVAIGILAILLSIMSSVSFRFLSRSLFEYILMFGFVAVGAALVLKTLFTTKN